MAKRYMVELMDEEQKRFLAVQNGFSCCMSQGGTNGLALS
jgi:hypothetical protein